MPDHVASQIAAGEVVERPASVVKELVENALDAGASWVRIELEAGGKRRIVVLDDGEGMAPDDALLAFDRHATSKISAVVDLERVATLGFRGEALASIAAVARTEMVTAPSAGEGTCVRIEGGHVRAVEPRAHPRGTRLEVASLFYNVPARRAFLKTPATELRRAVEIVQGYALVRPEVRFGVWHEGRELLDTEPAGPGPAGARRRIGQLFGAALEAALVPLPEVVRPDGGRVWGFLGRPETSRGRRHFLYVNRRLVRDRALLGVFYRAVREAWRSEDAPALFLFLDLPPETVDVNVHPQKAEVRFRDASLLEGVGAGLRRGLVSASGEGEAPLRSPASTVSLPAAAWEGAGGVEQGGAVAESRLLAEAVYAPAAPRPVPLSGRDGGHRRLRLLGQYKGTLILLEGPDGLYLIDQHVAHERVLYERLRRELVEGTPARQTLLAPLLLSVSAAERLRLAEVADDLECCGFSVTELSGDALALTAIPAGLPLDEAEAILLGVAHTGEWANGAAGLRSALLEAAAAGRACHSAVKMHEPLSGEEMQHLVSELFAAEQPYTCPHGRPIVLKMSDADLERRFGRR